MNRARRVMVPVLRAPFTRRAWRDVRFCVVGALTGVAGFVTVAAVLVPALALSAPILGMVIGLPLIVAALGVARGLGALHRLLLRTAGERVPAPPPFRPGSGVIGRLDRRLRDQDGWRAVGYAMAKPPVALVEGYAAATTVIGLADCAYPLLWPLKLIHPAGTRLLPLNAVVPVPDGHWAIWNWPGTLSAVLAGAGCVLAGVWLARGITTADARLMRSLLGPSRVSELDAAQAGVSGALADLRRIARGIHPPVLDSGLADALASLAAASPIPAEVRAYLPERPAAAIETMAYFCAAELLTNAIKHSSANEIEIIIDTERPGLLRIRVTDDGVGGARPSQGSGLNGLAQRAATVDGVLRLSSPRGGPTTVTVELPMRLRGRGV